MSYPGLLSRVEEVRDRVAMACSRAGRDPGEVTIVAVTKTHPADAVQAVRDAGIADVGENRVQELETKVAEIGRNTVRWHLIGHLQRNKARLAAELADLIHSVDSLRLARKLSDEGTTRGKAVECLVQVNVSGEATKGGIEGPGAAEQLAEIAALPGLQVRGLMTMAPFTDDEAVIRRVFAATRQLRDAAVSVSDRLGSDLSMGMSNDFEIAIEEGSTLVRLGTVLLGERGE